MLHEFADYADCVACVAKGAGDGQRGEVLLVGLIIATLPFQEVCCDVEGLEGPTQVERIVEVLWRNKR